MYMYMICPYLQHSVISGFIDGLTRPGTGSGTYEQNTTYLVTSLVL